MDAVGDVVDRDFFILFIRPQEGPHFPGNFPVKFRHAVTEFRQFQCQNRHGKRIPAPGLVDLGDLNEFIP